MRADFLKLMLVTNRKDIAISEYCKFVKICADSGIISLQLREKDVSDDVLLKNGEYIKRVLEPYKIPLIINDNVNVAKQLDADGVHLGQDDGDPKAARDLLGPEKIIGLSVDSKEELYIANQLNNM